MGKTREVIEKAGDTHDVIVAKLHFIWGKMRTAAQETAPQITLRECSKEAVGEVNIYDFGEWGVPCNQALILQKVFLLVVRG